MNFAARNGFCGRSISRFFLLVVDTIYFEEQNIYTLDSKGELLLTIMSSLAQEESRSISENVTWGQRKRFADGKVSMPYKQFLGYRKGENGEPEIVPEEAEVVRRIYRLFLDGMTPYKIKLTLEEEGGSLSLWTKHMAAQNRSEYPYQRKIQGRRASAKDLLHGFSH